ncbi:MAG: QueT transporter family protein [Candidatus Methanomethylicia archaeon]|nr:QueT transporter family protein [Candidatus Methanomethylicia archaeon]
MKSKDIAITAIFTTLYALGVVLLAPISFGIFQIRIADALLPLVMIYGLPVVFGTSLGCIIANFYGGLGPIDIIGGSIANFLACIIAYVIGRNSRIRRFIGCLLETIIITFIVGSYLSLIFNVPIEVSFLGIFIGSFISIDILGFIILESIYKIVKIY